MSAAEILDKAALACAALDTYHALLDRAAAELGTGSHLSRSLVTVERRRACLALTRLCLSMPVAEAGRSIREIREAVADGYSLPQWTLRIKRIAGEAAARSAAVDAELAARAAAVGA